MKIPIPDARLSVEEEAEILCAMVSDCKDAREKDRANRLANEYMRSLPHDRQYALIREVMLSTGMSGS